MRITTYLWLVAALVFVSASLPGAVSLQGGPTEAGYNAGSTATIRAVLTGAANADQYAVSAGIRYAGASSFSGIELKSTRANGNEIIYEGEWPIPADAPTGVYTVTFGMKDRSGRNGSTLGRAPSFFVYKKLLRITSVRLDRTFYAPGDRIGCELMIENLTGQDLKGLRVEFSNENYPWISTFSGEANAAGNMAVNPSLGLVVLRESLDIAAHGEARVPMQPAGTAAFLQGANVAIMGAGGPARHEKVASPESDRYTIAVWDHDRHNLLDMQFSPRAIVREPGQVLPKPYIRNFTHPYNSDIDFTEYREFYGAGHVSPLISIDRLRTLYAPGEKIVLNFTATNSSTQPGSGLGATITDPAGRTFDSPFGMGVGDWAPGATIQLSRHIWDVPQDAKAGVYTIDLLMGQGNREKASVEVAVNKLPASLMVFCPHEDDEHPFAGLMRAMVEAGRPVRVVFYTGGDVGECERYFDGHPCDPIRAREFGTVRMEESTEALEHIGVKHDQDIFLGLPDGGSGEIWFRHIQAANPFLSIYLAVDHTPYENAFQPNLPYARAAVIDAVKRAITDFHPAMIAVSHPDERHVDHRTANWFTLKACQELLREKRIDPGTIVLADQAYGSGGYKPAPYQYEKYVVYLSGEAAALKQEMSWIYQSQDGNLAEGAKQTFSELPRQELHYRIVDWQQHEGWNE